MARIRIPEYGTVTIKGITYYQTHVTDENGKDRSIYGTTCEEVYEKELDMLAQIDSARCSRKSPSVEEYCEKWLKMQSGHVRNTTMVDYTSKVRRHIIASIGDMRMADVMADDIQLSMKSVADKSASVYKSITVLYKQIFRAALDSRVIGKDPVIYLSAEGGEVFHRRIRRLSQMSRQRS